MKKAISFTKQMIGVMLVLAMVLILVPTSASAAKKVKLNKTKVTLKVGKTVTLKLKNNKKKVKWTSSNKKVATVTSKGKVKAKKAGKATITAKAGKKKYKCKVTVKTVKKAKSSTIPNNTQTVQNNYNKLKNYLLDKGFYGDSYRYIYTNLGSDTYTGRIEYYPEDDFFVFSEHSDEGDGPHLLLGIYPSNYNFGAVIVNYTYTAEGQVRLSSLTSTNPTIAYTSCDAPTSLKNTLYNLGDAMLGLGLVHWDYLLSSEVGLHLKDLGFTSYELT